MISERLAAYLDRRGIHYGWAVATATFFTMLATAGAMGAAGILIAPLEREFGWSNAEISQALAVRLVVFGLMGPFAAAFMNHFGVRRVVAVALVIIAAGVAGSLVMTEPWHLLVLWGVVVGIGTGMTALVLGATVATRWFSARRGFVVGLMTASNATGQLLFLPLLAALADNIGWRAAMALVVVILTVAFVVVLAIVRDRPEDVGLTAYGAEEMVTPPATAGRRLGDLLLVPLGVLREAAASATFWVLFATFFVCGFSTNGLIQQHWISLCGDFGIAPVGAASLLAVIGVFDLIGTILSGWLSDRFDNRWLLFWFYLLRGLSLIYLPFTDFSLYELSLFAIFYGLDWVATVPPTVKLVAERFGSESANLVFGWVFAGHQLGAAAAAYTAGASRTDFGTYLPALYMAGGLCLVAAIAILSLRRQAPQLQAA